MKTYNRGIKNVFMKVLEDKGLTILWRVDEFEEVINSYSLDYYEEVYEMVQALKMGLFDTIILNRHIPFKEAIELVQNYKDIEENECVFMISLTQDIIDTVEWNIEIVNLEEALENAREKEKIKDLHMIALAYKDGIGVPQDFEKAFELFKELEYMGDDEAYYHLGVMCDEGLGVEVNHLLAEQYWIQGASLNENECFYALGKKYYELGDYETARLQLIESEDPRAYGLLGDIYERNNAFEDAYRVYHKGALAYDPLSLYRLGRCYQEGMGVEKNIDEAIKYYSYAYYRKNKEATVALAHIFALGEDVEVNAKFAHDLYEQYQEEVENEDL